jgi:hypothetical protein
MRERIKRRGKDPAVILAEPLTLDADELLTRFVKRPSERHQLRLLSLMGTICRWHAVTDAGGGKYRVEM